MDNKTNIGLVNTHTKGNGGHNYIAVFHQECILVGSPGFGVQTGMIRHGFNAVHFQHFGNFLYLFSAQAVDDAGFAISGLDKGEYFFMDNILSAFGTNFIVKVGPVE